MIRVILPVKEPKTFVWVSTYLVLLHHVHVKNNTVTTVDRYESMWHENRKSIYIIVSWGY